jgi:hypothetical protein
MASATGIPDNSEDQLATLEAREDEPLLGQPGDVTQRDGVPINYNPLIGRPSSK